MTRLARASTIALGVLLAVGVAGGAPALAQGGPDPQPAIVRVIVGSARGPVARARVSTAGASAESDSAGRAVLRLPAQSGAATATVRRIGFAPDSVRVALRAGLDTTVRVVLREAVAIIAPVLVSSSRTERRVDDEPLRIEVLGGEDIAEKTQMHPADVRMLLSEMSGVRIQTTSPSLGGAAVRIQGLRGRDTQILVDGLPLYGAQAGGFGLLQIPPLDLRQAEVIKGAASALYGPNAMGGVVNLISRRPPDSSEALVNVTARGGADLVAFGARDFGAVGATVLVGAHGQRAVDVSGEGVVEIAGLRRLEVRPRLFVADSGGRAMMVTAGLFGEARGGGILGDAATAVPESLTTRHADLGATLRRPLSASVTLAARIAANATRGVHRFGVRAEAVGVSTVFGEVTSTLVSGAQTVLAGVAAQAERFRSRDVPRFDTSRLTNSVLLQHTLAPAAWLATQLDARCDASSVYGTICTPRASVLLRAPGALSIRLSAAGGWSAPTPDIEETELVGLAPVAGPLTVAAERARTASLDVGTTRGPLQINATLFAARVANRVGLRPSGTDSGTVLAFANARDPSFSHGGELFAVYSAEPLIVTAFYTATRTHETSVETDRVRESPYVPRETAGLDIAFDEDDSGSRVGLEVFYTGAQALEDNPYRAVAPPFTTLGLLASQRVGRATAYLNIENLSGVRQGRYDPVRRPVTSPGLGGRRVVDAWAPLEGRVLNAGIRLPL